MSDPTTTHDDRLRGDAALLAAGILARSWWDDEGRLVFGVRSFEDARRAHVTLEAAGILAGVVVADRRAQSRSR